MPKKRMYARNHGKRFLKNVFLQTQDVLNRNIVSQFKEEMKNWQRCTHFGDTQFKKSSHVQNS